MLQFATIGLSCLLMLGTLGAAPCATLKKDAGELRYCDTPVYNENGGNHTTEVVRRDFISKQRSSFDLAYLYPNFTFSPAVSSCAAVAGSNLIGFYDRYDENLIPNHKSGSLVLGVAYSYSIEDEATFAVTRELYDLMGIDETGATEAQFLDGIKKFCTAKGKSVTTTSCMSSGSFSFSKAKASIKANLPIVFFVSGYNVGFMAERDTFDSVGYMISTANHVMVGFGYKQMDYVTTEGNVTDYYFEVASGLGTNPSGVYNINYKTKIIDALAVNIY